MLSQTYLPSAAPIDEQAILNQPGVLALVRFDGPCEASSTAGIIPIGLQSLSGQPFELLRYGNEVATRGIAQDCHWSRIGDVLCAATWISPVACADIENATEDAYHRLFSVVATAGFAHPFRIWNFMPQINSGQGDQEMYKKFCVGRQRAFDRLQLKPHQYPAASALGHHRDGAVIYLLAHRQSGQHHENARQEPAYRYPRQYGPSSPSFARATSLTFHNRRQLFVSGTASILGHDTKAAGNLEQQLTITLENIRHLVSHTGFADEALHAIRVYLRNAEDYPAARAFLGTQFPADVVNFLHADICRDNLLVEIEAATQCADAQP